MSNRDQGIGPRKSSKTGPTIHVDNSPMTHHAKAVERAKKNVAQWPDSKRTAFEETSGLKLTPKSTGGALVSTAGDVLVNAKKFPALHAALMRGKKLMDEKKAKWGRVLELRKIGQEGSADRLMRKLLGIKPKKTMTEEEKEERRIYNETHKEEIAAKRKEKRERKAAMKEAIERQSKKIRMKRGDK